MGRSKANHSQVHPVGFAQFKTLREANMARQALHDSRIRQGYNVVKVTAQ